MSATRRETRAQIPAKGQGVMATVWLFILATWRLGAVVFGLALCVSAVAWKVSQLQFFNKDFLQGQGDNRAIRTIPIAANRGVIFDRNGEPLAVSTSVVTISVNPSKIIDNPNDIRRLANALDMNAEALISAIESKRDKPFHFVKRRLSPAEAAPVAAMRIPHVRLEDEYQRFYPQGEVAAHLVGFSNIDNVGQEGIELTYEEHLQGVEGRRQIIQDRRENIIEEIRTIETASNGSNIELSIDFRLQNLAYKELKAEFIKRRAKSATLVMLDVETGEVLAMANQPSYNPNNKSNISDFGVLRNRAVTDVFEPGSTVKAFTIAAALESGVYEADTIVETSPGWMMVRGHTIQDIHNYGTLTVGKVITKSSNVGTSKIALEIGPEPIRDVLERVGLGQVTGTGFPGERGGLLPSPRRWSAIETATLSYGYGLSVTALQLAQAYSVIADSGIRKPVSLVKLSADDVAALSRERVLSTSISAQIKDMLETVVDPRRGGSAREGNVPFYKVAGKTGTAHIVGEFGYEANLHNSLFVGMIPASDPKIVVVVVINEPKGSEHYGGQVAAPVFARVASGAMRLLNIPPDDVPIGQSVMSSGGDE
ncbi:penicillin-binding protein 2 [Gammaproteobacteria bacterium]|jgi:cell division protein FtsI (penicillin-binding protein 3)|nr:penicillin-binding protein 2 [Gammaproteobacteria bacterium]MBT6549523.1 penicillin-binding protein 2 [Gammaproteobacteria bacterium]MDA8617131.1 penicillin-binding protein 2 [Gammaproteobacteria bacterium]